MAKVDLVVLERTLCGLIDRIAGLEAAVMRLADKAGERAHFENGRHIVVEEDDGRWMGRN